jgi:hypothetical protein
MVHIGSDDRGNINYIENAVLDNNLAKGKNISRTVDYITGNSVGFDHRLTHHYNNSNNNYNLGSGTLPDNYMVSSKRSHLHKNDNIAATIN